MVPRSGVAGIRRDEEGFTMQEAEIYARLTTVFHEVFDDDVVLRPDLAADDVDGWDSLNHIRFMLGVSKAFKMKFSASAMGELKNIGDLVALIKRKSSVKDE